jgi:hypothetical protein
MLEPLTALSVAGTIVQFIDFSCRIITASVQLHRSEHGALKVNEVLEVVTSDLVKLTTKLHRLDRASGSVSEDEQALINLCDSCNTVADELLSRLKTLKVQGRHRKWESLRQAIKTVWAEEELSALGRKLITFKQSLELRILVDIRYVNIS